jgi:hypothetical protein
VPRRLPSLGGLNRRKKRSNNSSFLVGSLQRRWPVPTIRVCELLMSEGLQARKLRKGLSSFRA